MRKKKVPESEVVRIALLNRDSILRREAEVMNDLAKRWLELERALEAEMLRTAIELAKDAPITEAMILRNTRFQKLMYQARSEYSKFAGEFEDKITALQIENVTDGINDASKVLAAVRTEAGLAFAFDKLNVDAINMLFGFAADGSPLKSLLTKSYGEAANAIIQALATGIAKGLNPIKVAGLMADAFGIGLQRALTLARTEQLRAYRMAALDQYRSSGVVNQYKRLAKKDDKTCLGCLFADGETFNNEDDFSEHPNGRCVIIPVVNGVDAPTWETGKEWFLKLNEDRQRSILGDARFDAWKSGTPLEDMSMLKTDAVWGGSFVPTPLKILNQ
jgi:SPP1 gp7 family putative phage head morphogenesis protein